MFDTRTHISISTFHVRFENMDSCCERPPVLRDHFDLAEEAVSQYGDYGHKFYTQVYMYLSLKQKKQNKNTRLMCRYTKFNMLYCKLQTNANQIQCVLSGTSVACFFWPFIYVNVIVNHCFF